MEQKLREQLISFFEKSTFLGVKKFDVIAQAKDLDETKIEKLLLFIVEEIKAQADEIIDHSLRGDAREMARVFNQFLQIGKFTRQDLVNQYYHFIRQLQLNAFTLLSTLDRYEFVENAVIWAFGQNENLHNIFEEYLMEWTADDINGLKERGELIARIEINEELIGSDKLVYEEKKYFVPQVKNWLRDFKSQFLNEFTSLEIAKYLTLSPLVRQLSQKDKDILEKLLSLYLWFKNPFLEGEGAKKMLPKTITAIKEEVVPPRIPQPISVQKSAPVFPSKQPLPPAPVPARPSPAPVKPAPQPVFAPTIERYDAAAEKLVKESGLNVPLELQQRFKMIVVSRLKEVRKWVETRQKLMSPLENGGMGFSYEQAEKFLKLIDEKKEGALKNEIASTSPRNDSQSVVLAPTRDSSVASLPQNDKKKVAPPAPKKVLPPKENFSKDSSLRQPAEARNDNGEIALPDGRQVRNDKGEIASPVARNDRKVPSDDIKTSSDIQKIPPQPLKIVQQEKAALKIELAPLPPAQIKPAPKMAIPQTPAGRSKMEDVAYRPRLVGPVEELREMTLVDFRRLSPQAKVTADKIYAKIELLAEESYEKKIAGIKAWQESEVNKMYLGLLNESVDRAMPVQKMIEERQSANRPSLTCEEFKVVMELNRRLRN